MSKSCIKIWYKCVKNWKLYELLFDIFVIYMVYLLYIWIRKLVLKEFCMLSTLYKGQEREVLK